MAKNTGKRYEEFVGAIQQSLINAEQTSYLKNITVELNKKIIDLHGIARQFDVYWEFELGGYKYKSVIECKDYASTITIEKIDAFLGKTADIPGLRCIYATKTGYQNGARLKAERHKIDLLIVREANDHDWCTPEGDPLIKQIALNIKIKTVPKIVSFTPFFDEFWLKNQKHSDIISLNQKLNTITNNKVFISNPSSGYKISLYDLAIALPKKIKNIQYGRDIYNESLTDCYLEVSDLKIGITGYQIEYGEFKT